MRVMLVFVAAVNGWMLPAYGQDSRLRPDTFYCHYGKAPILDDGKSDALTIAKALMFECHQDQALYYAQLIGAKPDDLRVIRIQKDNYEFDLGRAISAVLVLRIKKTSAVP
jgi:hypothetical protein